MDDTFKLLVVGSRSIRDYDLIKKELDKIIDNRVPFDQIEIVSGGANGVDSLVRKYALDNGCQYRECLAQWRRYGRSAGYRRNFDMHKYIAESKYRACVAFWDGVSSGTKHNFELADQFKNPLKIIRINIGQASIEEYIIPDVAEITENEYAIEQGNAKINILAK